jgi:hypothetical protein
MATVRFTEADRDGRGFIRLTPPEAAPEEATEAAAPPPRPARPAAPARPPLSPRLRYQLTMAGAVVAGLLLVLLTMRMSLPRQMATATATAASILAAPPTAQQPSPTMPPAAMLPAYAAPNGAALGQIEATRDITPTAHYSSDWIQADVQGSGLVWLRAVDFPRLAIVGPDLAPRPTATARPYVPPTPEPEPPCLAAGTPGKMVEVCGWGDLAAEAQATWLATYGGNPGIVTTPTPAEWSKP